MSDTTPADLVQVVQLTEDADWDTIAAWCGGTVETSREADDEYVSWIEIPRETGPSMVAGEDAWIVRNSHGGVHVISPLAGYHTLLSRTTDAAVPQTVWEAVYEVIRSIPRDVHENARVWHAVYAALEALGFNFDRDATVSASGEGTDD